MARDNKVFGNEIMVKLGDKEGGRERQELRVNNKSIKILIIHVNYIHFNTWNNVFVIISIDFLCFVMISRNHISPLFFSLKYHVSGDIAFAFIKFICFSNSPSWWILFAFNLKIKGTRAQNKLNHDHHWNRYSSWNLLMSPWEKLLWDSRTVPQFPVSQLYRRTDPRELKLIVSLSRY